MTKAEAKEGMLAAKADKGLSYGDLSEAVGCDKVWVSAAIEGQTSAPKELADSLASALGLGIEVSEALQAYPMKGALDTQVPVDPLIYRFHEITQVYGTTMKAVIHEKFGDGIMSAIDFDMHIEKVEHPKGDRVKVTMTGKFLPYNKW